jgi:hypothetical protein
MRNISTGMCFLFLALSLGLIETRPLFASPRSSATGGVARFDGYWSVSARGSCASGASGQVTISAGRVFDSSGAVIGIVSSSGAVSTQASFNGTIITGRGRISGRSASGTFRQSDGCSGGWSAVRY